MLFRIRLGWLARLKGLLTRRLLQDSAPVAPIEPFSRAVVELPKVTTWTPKVSIIILNRDGAEHLENLFSSFHAVNDYPNLELILVDHASTDASLEVARRWAEKLPLEIIPCSDNYSFSHSNNRAAEFVDGELLCFLNNDVTFTKDILGRMVAAMETLDEGVVGIRQLEVDDQIHHFGLRLHWNESKSMLTPYHPIPGQPDERILRSPTLFPAVTGSVLMCRRDTFLERGGFHESYYYAYEDVDLCFKYSLSNELPVVALNDVEIIHDSGSTRRGPLASLRTLFRQRDNCRVLDYRFGYLARRRLMREIVRDDGSFYGERTTATLIGETRDPQMTESLAAKLGWRVNNLPAGQWAYDLCHSDVLLLATPKVRLSQIVRARPHLLCVTWVDHPDRQACDLVLDGPPDPLTLREALVNYVTRRHRFSFKTDGRGDNHELALKVADLLRAQGHGVRVDPPGYWDGPHGLADDVVVYFSDPGSLPHKPNKINLVAQVVDDRPENFLGTLGESQPAELAGAILRNTERFHRSYMNGPSDQPLRPRKDRTVPPPNTHELAQ